MPSLLRTWTTAFVGLMLLQAVWLLVVPPFQGIDEHDHVFKAAAVARGDWSRTHQQVASGRGELLAVPRDIVEGARPVCEALSYTGRDDCRPSAELADGRVLVGSAAARYNPAFYAVTGTVARPFHGVAAAQAMRITTAVWCAALMALAFAVVRRTARTSWPTAALVAACTPTMLYSTIIGAPNGPEMAAGLLLWCALLYGSVDGAHPPRWVVVAGTVAAAHIAVLRSLGPLWLALILGTAALAMGVPGFLRASRSRRFRPSLVVAGIAVGAGVAWTLTSGTNDPSTETGPHMTASPWPKMFSNWIAWVLQQVAAVPSRNNDAPIIVYALVIAAWALLLVLALRAAPGRARLATVAIFVIVSLMAISITVLSFAQLGYAWQGRYAWPYVVGWLALAGWMLDRSTTRTRGAGAISVMIGTAMAAGFTVTALDLANTLSALSGGVLNGWTPPHPLLVSGLAVTGPGLLLLAMRQAGATGQHERAEDRDRREAGRQALIR
ncbi:DUF2142 domain-containing protein [Nocardioides sp. InS609-2]|uniref:DUF2142 domain-containing protein n=1 Tax=Nocardioides sp. InS609-2 TaxID=2760705 RepID=UPI0020BF5309|nr:DUF2142 domain-containing protein [Nocardioides sp. InS609-2]